MSRSTQITGSSPSFQVSEFPLVSADGQTWEMNGSSSVRDDSFGQLPRTYGQTLIHAVARDPKSLLVYWDIDWSSAFAKAAPRDRKIFLRIHGHENGEVNRIEVEPLANVAKVVVPRAGSSVRIEIGYFSLEHLWYSVGMTPAVTTPPDKIGALVSGDFALVPFHVTFQRLTELFLVAKQTNEPLTQLLVRFERTVFNQPESVSLAMDQEEVYRAMKESVRTREHRPVESSSPADEMKLERSLRQVAGFGPTSRQAPFGSSRSA